MKISLSFFIGWRYVRSKRRNGFISFVSWFALIGMAVGVFSLMIVLSVMNGFDQELKQRILRVVPHGFITTDKPLSDWQALARKISQQPNVVATAPFIQGTGLVGYAGETRPIHIQGIEPDFERNISVINDYMVVGSLTDLDTQPYGVVLGRLLANNLGLNIGDKISITLPMVTMTPAGIFPRSRKFILTGVFEVGAQVDQTLALIHIRDAQKLFRYGKNVEGVHVKFDDIYQASAGVKQVVTTLGEGHSAKDWSQTQGSLFQAVKMEKTVVGIMLSIIIAVAAFNIVTSLTMMVMEKRSNIAVLRTLGMNRFSIMIIFLAQGVTMGVIGVGVGGLIGSLIAINISSIIAYIEQAAGWQLFDPVVYFVTFLPSKWQSSDAFLVCGFAIFACVLASIYPAWRASKIEPAEALRYDI